MKHAFLGIGPVLAIAVATIAPAAALADDGHDHGKGGKNSYVVNKLVSDLPGAAVTDPVLQNSWGVAFSPAGSPFWIADNATGCATLYDGDGTIVPLQVSIPLPGNVVPTTDCKHADAANPPNPTPAAPTGVIWNPATSTTTGFLVPGTMTPAVFIFDTEDGTISAWGGGSAATIAVDNSGAGAVYKGLAFGVNASGDFLYATNFRNGTVDVFDHNYNQVTLDGNFQDPMIPADYAPFGIQNINGDLFVSYAKQNAEKHDDVAGKGHGFVDVYDTDGHLLKRFATRGTLNSPWGMARASFAFGPFSGDILIGDFGDGRVNVFDSDGNFIDQLNRADGKPLAIDGLWTLTLGGGAKSRSDTLFFTAGPNGETDGLFGTIAPR